MSVAVLGGGAFGTALAHVVAEARGEEVVLWSDDAEVAEEIGAKRTLARRLPGLVIEDGDEIRRRRQYVVVSLRHEKLVLKRDP